jgi:hypothetical protein
VKKGGRGQGQQSVLKPKRPRGRPKTVKRYKAGVKSELKSVFSRQDDDREKLKTKSSIVDHRPKEDETNLMKEFTKHAEQN